MSSTNQYPKEVQYGSRVIVVGGPQQDKVATFLISNRGREIPITEVAKATGLKYERVTQILFGLQDKFGDDLTHKLGTPRWIKLAQQYVNIQYALKNRASLSFFRTGNMSARIDQLIKLAAYYPGTI